MSKISVMEAAGRVDAIGGAGMAFGQVPGPSEHGTTILYDRGDVAQRDARVAGAEAPREASAVGAEAVKSAIDAESRRWEAAHADAFSCVARAMLRGGQLPTIMRIEDAEAVSDITRILLKRQNTAPVAHVAVEEAKAAS